MAKFPTGRIPPGAASPTELGKILSLMERALAINRDILRRLARQPRNVALRRELREFQELAYLLACEYEIGLERYLTRRKLPDI
jgi:hypothetical protein